MNTVDNLIHLRCFPLLFCHGYLHRRHALHEMLGGEAEYTCYHTEIGDANVLFGEIALIIFARTK